MTSSNLPSIQLDLGNLEEEGAIDSPNYPPSGSNGNEQQQYIHHDSMVKKAIHPDVEREKCVIAQYKTTSEQLSALNKLLDENETHSIPLEWVIDIADESNGWFYGTAYHYNDNTNMLHVMVPDKLNPSFDGEIPLDHRTVHLVECVDGYTEALFNKIIRDSITKVRWEVEWFEEGNGVEKQIPEIENSPEGRWVHSMARYYIQMANQLLVEDEDIGQESRGFVMLTADLNVKLRTCIKGKGMEDFTRLINEGMVQSLPNAIELSKKSISALSADRSEAMGFERQPSNLSTTPSGAPGQGGGNSINSVRKLAEMSRGLRECLSDILDDRERLIVEHEKMAKAFNLFIMDGDLDAGLKLMAHTELIIPTKEKHGKHMTPSKKQLEREQQQELMDSAAEDVWYLAQRVEKSSVKLLKSGGVITNGAGGGGSGGGESGNNLSPNDEIEYLRRAKAKLQRDLDEKEKELETLRDGR
jgi:hypothetical protein